MKAPTIGLTATGVLGLVAVAGVAYLAYRLYKGAGGAIAGAVGAVSGAVQQGAANVTQAFNNATSAPAQQTERSAMYGNLGYTGSASGVDDPTTGDWFGNADARRYSYQQRDAGGAPAAESINGAAFGIHPSSGRRKQIASQERYQAPPATTNGQNQPDQPALSFTQGGASFKDLASSDAVNPFASLSTPLGQLH